MLRGSCCRGSHGFAPRNEARRAPFRDGPGAVGIQIRLLEGRDRVLPSLTTLSMHAFTSSPDRKGQVGSRSTMMRPGLALRFQCLDEVPQRIDHEGRVGGKVRGPRYTSALLCRATAAIASSSVETMTRSMSPTVSGGLDRPDDERLAAEGHDVLVRNGLAAAPSRDHGYDPLADHGSSLRCRPRCSRIYLELFQCLPVLRPFAGVEPGLVAYGEHRHLASVVLHLLDELRHVEELDLRE